jgi:pre-rRNA-processing protein TSR1
VDHWPSRIPIIYDSSSFFLLIISTMSHSHRPTLKQSNKAYKSKHSSKGSLKDAAKGRIAKKTTSSSSASAIKNSNHGPAASQMKANRRNTAKQLQAAKRAQLADKSRQSAGKSEARAPRIVTLIQLCEDTDSNQAVQDLLTSTSNLHGDAGLQNAADLIRQVEYARFSRLCQSPGYSTDS